MALEDVPGEEAARPELGGSQVERARARPERADAVAVPAVGPIAAELVGLLVHDGVDHLLGEQPERRLDVDHPVGRPRDGGLLRHRVRLYLHSGPCPFPEPVLCSDSRFWDRGRLRLAVSRRRAYTNISAAIFSPKSIKILL